MWPDIVHVPHFHFALLVYSKKKNLGGAWHPGLAARLESNSEGDTIVHRPGLLYILQSLKFSSLKGGEYNQDGVLLARRS